MPRVASKRQGLSNPIFCLILGGALIGAFAMARAALGPLLGDNSPYMLFIAAVLVAGFARGVLCGLVVMLGGGVAGLLLFSGWQGDWATAIGPMVSLVVFWAVSALVLMMSNELRRHANAAFSRLQARGAQDRPVESAESQTA